MQLAWQALGTVDGRNEVELVLTLPVVLVLDQVFTKQHHRTGMDLTFRTLPT